MTLCIKCKEMTKHLKYCKHLANSLAREQVKYCPFRFVSSMSLIFSRCLGVRNLSTTQDDLGYWRPLGRQTNSELPGHYRRLSVASIKTIKNKGLRQESMAAS